MIMISLQARVTRDFQEMMKGKADIRQDPEVTVHPSAVLRTGLTEEAPPVRRAGETGHSVEVQETGLSPEMIEVHVQIIHWLGN